MESFAPDEERGGAKGTVRAHDPEDPPNTDFQQHTCNILSCGGTCWLTPNVCGSCGCGESGFDPCG